MRVEVDPEIEVSAKTVGDLRKVTAWPKTLAVTTPQERHADSAVKVSKVNAATRTAPKTWERNYAAEVANTTGSTIEGSSFSGLLTRVEIGHIRIGSAGNGRIRSPGSGSSLSHRV
jgi:hypothetical protein